MKHDYKATLEAVTPYLNTESPLTPLGLQQLGGLVVAMKDPLINALAMMEKLQEPSEGMALAGIKAWNGGAMAVVTQFKAMLEEAEKEIEG